MPRLALLATIRRAVASPFYGAGDHLPSDEEMFLRRRRRWREEEALILYAMGEISLEQTKELVGV